MSLSSLTWLWTVGLALPTLALAGGGPELCVVKRLERPDFSGVLLRPVPSGGCTANCLRADQEVHIIRLSTRITNGHTPEPQDRPKATLTVRAPAGGGSSGRRTVLLLVGSSLVDWSVFGRGMFDNHTSFQILVNGRSRVVQTDLPSASVSSQPALNRTALLQSTVEQYGCVTSFTEVAVADLVDLTLGTDRRAPAACDTGQLSPNPALSAYQRQPVSLDGCYHRHLAGIGTRDVYVIEVAEQERRFSRSDVTIHLAPADSTRRLSANITLLLKASMPVTWSLETDRLSGDVLVVTEDPVVNSSLDWSAVSLKVKPDRLPSSFSDLLVHTVVNYSSGPPVAFVRSPAVDRISIGLPSRAAVTRAPEGDSLDETSFSKHASKSSEKVPPDIKRDMRPPKPTGVRTVPSGALRHSLSVTCELGRLVVAVPAAEADLWRVDALRLADPACRSFRNTTYLVISQPLDACLTRRRVVDGNAVYDNTVHFVSSGAPPDDEDFEGSGSGLGLLEPWEEAAAAEEEINGGLVPVSCSHPGRVRSPEVNPSQSRRHQLQEGGLTDGGVDTSGYSLDLFSDQLFTSPIEANALIPVTHTIYVRASVHIVAAPDLRPVVEQCWISKDSDASAPYKFLVVRAACPVDGSVTFLRSRSSDGDLFTFQVSRQYLDLGPYYLHCRVGLCARPFSPTSLRVAQCLDRLRYCTASPGGGGGRLVASGVQVVTRGPLLPTVTDISAAPDWGQGSDPATDHTPLVRPGVQPETVAGIGVAAFVLGLTLMGGVWLIHSKIGPSKRHQFQAVPQNPTLEVAGQSANSTPSSQTPIII